MIYTRTGDGGTTSLVGGSRVSKDDVRVEAYGTVDELNSHVGLVAEMLKTLLPDQYQELKAAQNHLFALQTLLATEDKDIYSRLPKLDEAEVAHLEQLIDALNAKLPQLRSFVIAGGNMVGAECHVARTVCRRAERRVVTLAGQAEVEGVLMRYLNRLSDYLFVLSRYAVVTDNQREDLYIM